jgi:hypothetical protein
MPWGPQDPPIPDEYRLLAATSSSPPQCDELAASGIEGEFWALAIAVCRAIIGDGAWPDTRNVPAPPPKDNDYQECLDEELADMLGAALTWHSEHPDATPEISYPVSSSRSPCQSAIYDVFVDVEAEVVPPPGSVAVAILAAGVDENSTVTVDGEAVDADIQLDGAGEGLDRLEVVVALTEEERTAEVAVSTAFGPLTATVELPANDESPQP